MYMYIYIQLDKIFISIFLLSRITLSCALCRVSHPISLGIILVTYSLVTSARLIFFRFSWFFYLLILVFLGGVIVLIIYMSTLSANEKFTLRFEYPLNSILFVFLWGFRLTFFIGASIKYSNRTLYLCHMYEYINHKIRLFLIIYLLVTLLCVVKLVKFDKGPLVIRL